MLSRSTSLALAIVLAMSSLAHAGQYNVRGGIDARNAVKRNSALVQAQTLRAKGVQSNLFGQPLCGEERNGVTVVRRPDGETVIVANKISNFGGNIRIDPDCR